MQGGQTQNPYLLESSLPNFALLPYPWLKYFGGVVIVTGEKQSQHPVSDLDWDWEFDKNKIIVGHMHLSHSVYPKQFTNLNC